MDANNISLTKYSFSICNETATEQDVNFVDYRNLIGSRLFDGKIVTIREGIEMVSLFPEIPIFKFFDQWQTIPHRVMNIRVYNSTPNQLEANECRHITIRQDITVNSFLTTKVELTKTISEEGSLSAMVNQPLNNKSFYSIHIKPQTQICIDMETIAGTDSDITEKPDIRPRYALYTLKENNGIYSRMSTVNHNMLGDMALQELFAGASNGREMMLFCNSGQYGDLEAIAITAVKKQPE